MSPNDPEPFDRLHDGVIIGVEREGDTATLLIQCGYLRARLPGERGPFRLRLSGVRTLRYLPYGKAVGEEDPPIEDPAAIAAEEANLSQSKIEDDGTVSVYCGLGRLHVDYDAYSIALDDGTPVSMAELNAAGDAYWDEWRKEQKK